MAFKKFVQDNGRTFSQEVRLHPRFKFACCECGLVHDMQIGVLLKVRRNKRATVKYRRAMKLRET